MKRSTIWLAVFLTLSLPVVQAQTVYIDADAANTELADGSGLPWFSTSTSSSDGLWRIRTDYGNDAFGQIVSSRTLFQGYEEILGQLVTTASGLTADGWYRVDAVYWSKSAAEDWNVTVGFTPESRTIYSFTGAVISGLATIPGEQTGRSQSSGNGPIYELTGLVGYIQADANGEIKVYVDCLEDNVNQLERTWYDGLLITAVAEPPAVAPTDLTATGVDGAIDLAWTQSVSQGVASNRIYRSTAGSGGPYSLLFSVLATNAYSDSAVTDGQLYYYVVTAINADGESLYSDFASAMPWVPPEAPSGLSATGTNSVATLAWTQSVSSGIVSNRIYRSTSGSGGPYNLLAGLSAGTAYVDASVSTGLTYYYQVTAVDSFGESAGSDPAFTTPQAPGSAPGVIAASPIAGSSVGILDHLSITFSSPVYDVDASDLLINGQPASGITGSAGSSVYTFQFAQPAPGEITISWDSGHGIFEPGGTLFDAGSAGNSWSYTLLDTVPPQVDTTTPIQGSTVASLTQVSITFTEPVVGVNASDLRVNSLSASSVTGSGAGPYVFQFSEPASGIVQLSWASGHGIVDGSAASNAFVGEGWANILDPAFGQTLRINEFLTSNGGGLQDEDLESPDWIEIKNVSADAVNLDGWVLTDNPSDLTKWTFPSTTLPAGGYLVVFASGKNRATAGPFLHTNFQLSNNGGYLALVRPDGVVAHAYAPEYPDQRANVSYGLSSSDELRYFSPSTPGASNETGYAGLVADTKFSVDRGFYDSPFTVEITCASAGASIYWTTNGSIPTLSNGTLYTGPVPVSGTTLLRATALLADHVSSIPDAQTYIFLAEVLQQPAAPAGYPTLWQSDYPADYEMDPNVVNSPNYGATLAEDLRSIPTLSIVSDHDSFWDPATGIYVDARDAATGGVDRGERAASVELFNGDGTSEFQANCGIQMQGNASRDNVRLAKHSFRLLFKGEYGPSKLDYDWFNSSVKRYNTLPLRACFTDSWATRANSNRYRPHDSLYLRDVWVKEAMRDMGNLAGHGDFVHLYVNGLYWGLYNPTERLDATFFSDYLGGYEKDWDVIRDFNSLMEGSKTDWNNLMTLVNAGVDSDADYQAVAELVDIDNLIDYFILHFLIESEDWPSHNWYAAHRRANAVTGLAATKWIFLPWDQEIALDTEASRDKTTVSNDGTPARIYSQLRSWPEFQVRFGDRVQKHMFNGGALTPANNIVRLQELVARVDRAIVGESARWGDAREFTIGENPGHGETFTRDEWWIPEVQKLTTSFLPNVINPRTITRLQNRDLYPGTAAPVFSQFGGAVPSGFGLVITNPGASGTIYYTLDGTDPRVYGSGSVAPAAVAYSAPVVITAPTLVRARVLSSTGKWSALVGAAFYPPQDLSQLALTEIMYHPPDLGATDGNQLEFLELKNMGLTNLDLSGLTFTRGIDFTFPNGTIMAPGQFFVLARDATAFAFKYPGVAIHGIYSGKLDNGGEKITLSNPIGSPVFSVTYNDREPWPVTPDLADFSLVQRNSGVSQAPDQGTDWRASTYPGGSPGSDDPDPQIAPIVINEILAHTDLPQKDSVELYNPAATNVNVGGWFLSDDAAFPQKFRIPDHTIIPPGGWVYFDEDDFNPTPGAGTGFSLSSTGDDIYLFAAATNGTLLGYNHAVGFGASFNGVSFGRYVNSVGEELYPSQIAVSLGATNAGPKIGSVVINEINYHPDLNSDEFVEIRNITASPVPLYSETFPENAWKISGLGFTLPTNVTLGANRSLLVVAIEPAEFRSKYSIPESVPIYGPYLGELQDSGENLELQAPDNPNVDGVPYVSIDTVRYNDKLPWPPSADGGGMALRRIVLSEYGNDPANWTGAVPTAGGMPVIVVQPRDVAAYAGEAVAFHVSAAGYEPFGYQWFSNDVALAGQTASNLVLAGVQSEQTGIYRVQVTNTVGAVSSDDAMLAVANWPAGGLEWVGDEDVRLFYPVLPGRLYQVEYRTNLVDGDWLPFGPSVFAVSNRIDAGNMVTNDLQRFYRLKTLP